MISRPGILFHSEILPVLTTGAKWPAILTLIKKQKVRDYEEYLVGPVINYYESLLKSGSETSCADLVASAAYYFDHYPNMAKDGILNGIAWDVFQYSSDKNELNMALGWAKRAIEFNNPIPSYYAAYTDTYANLLYKLGNKNEAIAWESKALHLSPKTPAFSINLEKMKKGEITWNSR